MPFFCDRAELFRGNKTPYCIQSDMARPQESLSKVAGVFGVTRQTVYKWKHAGAPFDSANALLDWLKLSPDRRLFDRVSPDCPELRQKLTKVLSVDEAVHELAEIFGVTYPTAQSWIARGAPVEDPFAMAEWAMKEPGIFEGFTRTQETADMVEAIEDPELQVDIRSALIGWRASPAYRAWRRWAAAS